MRFRAGVAIGFAVGYYFGAQAGRERYEQMRDALSSLPLGALIEKAQALLELAAERVREVGAENVVPLRAVSRDE
jgi:hypothetical protein